MVLRDRRQGRDVFGLAGREGCRGHRDSWIIERKDNIEDGPRASNHTAAERSRKAEKGSRHRTGKLKSWRLRLKWQNRKSDARSEGNDTNLEELSGIEDGRSHKAGRDDSALARKARGIHHNEMPHTTRRKDRNAKDEGQKSERAMGPIRGGSAVQAPEGPKHARRLRQSIRIGHLGRLHHQVRRTPRGNSKRCVQSSKRPQAPRRREVVEGDDFRNQRQPQGASPGQWEHEDRGILQAPRRSRKKAARFPTQTD